MLTNTLRRILHHPGEFQSALKSRSKLLWALVGPVSVTFGDKTTGSFSKLPTGFAPESRLTPFDSPHALLRTPIYSAGNQPGFITMSSLASQMKAALKSREERIIRRSLPDPAESQLVDFNSNDYLSLTKYEPLRSLFLSKLQSAPEILGSGGSRLLVNGRAHDDLEKRLARFFYAPAALLYNSGLDANIGFFSCVPQPGDFVVSDEYIHASVHDGVRASRVRGSHRTFNHNSVTALREVLENIISEKKGVDVGRYSVFVAVESLYSMDGTFSPLTEIVELVEELFPLGNGYIVVDEAHTTGIYGPQGRGIVTMLGLENRVLARLHTFGKALGSSGGLFYFALNATSY